MKTESIALAIALWGFGTIVEAQTPKIDKSQLLGTMPMNCPGKYQRCIVPVMMATSQDGSSCTGYIGFSDIQVSAPTFGGKPLVIWQLFKAFKGDNSAYAFAAAGVDIHGNDTSLDFDQNMQDDNDSTRFRWRSVHGRTKVPLQFDVYVVNTSVNGDDGRPLKCVVGDPTITNE